VQPHRLHLALSSPGFSSSYNRVQPTYSVIVFHAFSRPIQLGSILIFFAITDEISLTSGRSLITSLKPLKRTSNDRHDKNSLLTMAQAHEYAGVSKNTITRLIDARLLNAEQVVPYATYAIEKSVLTQIRC